MQRWGTFASVELSRIGKPETASRCSTLPPLLSVNCWDDRLKIVSNGKDKMGEPRMML